MKALIFGTAYRPHHRASLESALQAMARHGIFPCAVDGYWSEVEIDSRLHSGVARFVDFDTTPVDVVIAFGGDGTVLGAIALINEREIPILGINLGRLGFLSSIEARHAGAAIEAFARGRFRHDLRTMLRLEVGRPIFDGVLVALNDFTLHKRDNSSMITIHTYLDGELLNSFWADGLIVSTPTGSTGYSLSCGGPIVFPASECFVITPVAPHNLTVRPIVIPDDAVISFEVEGRAENFLCTLDSRFEIVTAADALTIRKARQQARLVQLEDYTFTRTLQEKLNWGKDTRN